MMRSFLACLVSWVLLVGFSGWGTAAENGDDENLLREAGIGTDGPALLRFLRSRIATEADRAQVESLIRQLGHDDFEVRERRSPTWWPWGPRSSGS